MAQESILGRLVERWHVQYDRVIWNIYFIFFALAGIVGKDAIVGNTSLENILKGGTVASWYILWATLLLISFLLWYNYTSWLLSFASFLLIEKDDLYKAFWADRSRLRASMLHVLLSNWIFYLPPLLILSYYNYELGFGYGFSWYALFARLCGMYFALAVVMRFRTLLLIKAKFRNLVESMEHGQEAAGYSMSATVQKSTVAQIVANSETKKETT